MSGRWFPFLTLVMLLALSVACEQPGAPATPASPQALKVSQTVKVGTSTPGPTETPAPDPTDSPTPTITPTPLPMLTAGEFTLSYEIHANTLILRTPESAQEVTFPAEITDVTAKGESLKVTLTDGTEKTLTQDKETGEWKEVQIYRTLTELAPTAENMLIIKKAVADVLADGAFLDETEIKEKIEVGELKVVRDEKTGAIMVFTKQVLEYMKEKGQNVENSDAARLFQALDKKNEEVFGKWIDAKVYSYEEYYQKRLDYPEELQKFAERLAKDGGFLPLSSEWMTFSVRLNQANRPEVIAILPQFLDPWDRSYPAGKRIFGNPISFPDDKRLMLGIKLWLENDQVKKQFIQAPFITQYRGQQLTLEPEANELVNRDEYQTVTHKLDEEKRQWHELKEYEAYGTARERLVQMLTYKVFEEKRMVDGKEHTNVFGLDRKKVQAVIDALKAGKSIEEINANEAKAAGIYILVDAEGNPAQIAIVGGEYGLTAEQLASLKKAAAGIEAVDPGRLTFLAEQFGAKFISREDQLGTEAEGGTFSSNNYTDTIFAKSKSVKSVPDFVLVLLAESGEIHVGRHMTSELKFADKMSEYHNVGVFASQWTIDWLKLHGDGLIEKGVINQKELNDIINLAKYNLEQYQNSP